MYIDYSIECNTFVKDKVIGVLYKIRYVIFYTRGYCVDKTRIVDL